MFQSFDLILLLTIKVPTISGSGPIGSSNRDLEVPFSDGSRARRTPRMSFSVRLGQVLINGIFVWSNTFRKLVQNESNNNMQCKNIITIEM
jgi:hypothetical protein